MSEKEIIEYLECSLNDDWNYYNCTKVKDRIAIQGILNLYKQEKEKNKLLKTYKGNLPENVELICLCKDDFERNISTDYISKDKIREKIKELEDDTKQENYTFVKLTSKDIRTTIITNLKELLEENKSNENNI